MKTLIKQLKLNNIKALYEESSDYCGAEPIKDVEARAKEDPYWYEKGNGCSFCVGCEQWFNNIHIMVVDHVTAQICPVCLFSVVRLYLE